MNVSMDALYTSIDTILLMAKKPATIRNNAHMSIGIPQLREAGAQKFPMYFGLYKYMKIARAKGKNPIKYPVTVCCDVSTLISPLILTLSRMVCEIVSRISARLPPTSR
jgi:hypothetical protein